MKARVLALALFSIGLAGCGGGNPEIWLVIGEDGTKPCLGAAHMQIEVITADGVSMFHEFGWFFSDDNACAIGQFRFPGLPLGSGIQIAVSMWDSTSDTNGQLATGASLPTSVAEDTPLTQLDVALTRTTAALGTIAIRQQPSDWTAISGINRLQYRITPAGEDDSVRSGFFSYDPELRSDPFPLTVSALPLPAVTTQYDVVIEALQDLVLVRAWRGSAHLGSEVPNPADVAELQ